MPTITNLSVKIGADIRDLQKKMDQATRSVRDMGKRMKSTGRTLTMGITAPMAALGGVAVKTAGEFESLQQSMNILNGSVEEGARNFERLKEFSAETPFQLRDLAEAQNMLQGFGLSADEAFESMSMIGDIAAVASGDIKGIGIAFGQAAAEGRLMTRDIRQLINQGVPAIKLLSNTMNVAESEIFDMASQGEISFQILQKAFREATEEGGIFANGMEKQANTILGVWSTLKDRVSLALGELGGVIVDTLNLKQLAKDIGANLQAITQRFADMSQETQTQVLKVAGLFMAGGPILMALGQAAIAISAFAKLVRTRFAAITAAALLVAGTIEQQSQLWSKVFGDSEKEVDNFTTSARKGIMKLVGPVLKFTEEALGAGDALDNFMGLLKNLGGEAGQKARNVLNDTANLMAFIGGDATALAAGLDKVSNKAKSVARNFKDVNFGTAELSDTYKNLTVSIGEATNKLSNVPTNLNKIKKAGDLTKIAMRGVKEESVRMGQALQQSATGAISSFAETLGKAFSGDLGAKNFFQSILMVVNDFANRFGKLLVAAGVAAQSFKSLITNPVAAIVAGGALIALTTAIRGMLQSGPEAPALAEGGLAYGPTLATVGDNPNARSNPEVIAPLDKLQGMMGGNKIHITGEFRQRGSDLVAVIDQAKTGTLR